MQDAKIIRKGFTLIEILVVVSIIAILAGLALTSFSQPQKQANDTVRKNDLRQYGSLLKQYAANNGGFYPCRGSAAPEVASGSLCTDLGLTAAECPIDPKSGTTGFDYRYTAGSISGAACEGVAGTASAANFVLYALIESSATTRFVVCSNGDSGTIASTVSIINGACPATLN